MYTVSVLINFLLFVAVNSVENTEDSCKHEGCHDKVPTIEFPGNEDELDQFCIMYKDYYSCIVEFLITCRPEEYEDTTRLNSMSDILDNICDKNTEIYKALAQHIGCIKDTLMNFNVSCQELSKEISLSRGNPDSEDSEDIIKYHCLRRALEIACLAMKVGESCGVSGEEAFVDVINELKKESDFCGEEGVFEKIAKYSDEVEMEEKLKNRLLTILDQQ